MAHATVLGNHGSSPLRVARALLPLILALTLAVPSSVRAREPLLTVAKNMLLGGMTGLVLGGTLTLVVDEDSKSDVVRWGLVAGTFGGFAFGVWTAWRGDDDLFAATRAPGLASASAAQPFAWVGDLRSSAQYHGPDADGPMQSLASSELGRGWAVRIPVVSMRW